jgi:ElaB/YqjD/DUF883 family membrane-anchored ribosome-binding protein
MFQYRSSEFAPSVASIQRHLGAVEKELESIGRVAGRRGSAAARTAAEQIGDALTSILSDMMERFRDGGRQAVQTGSKYGAKYGDSAIQRVSAEVRGQPLITLGVALGVGVLIGAAVLGASWRK